MKLTPTQKLARLIKEIEAVKNIAVRAELLSILDSAQQNGADTAVEKAVEAGAKRNENGHLVLTHAEHAVLMVSVDEWSLASMEVAADCANANRVNGLSKGARRFLRARNIY